LPLARASVFELLPFGASLLPMRMRRHLLKQLHELLLLFLGRGC